MNEYTKDFISHIFSINENIAFTLVSGNNLISAFMAYALIFIGFVLIVVIFKFIGFAETKITKILIAVFCLFSIFPLSIFSFYLGNYIIEGESKYMNSVKRNGNELKIFNDFNGKHTIVKKDEILNIKVKKHENEKKNLPKMCFIEITTKEKEVITLLAEDRKISNINHPGC